MAASAARKHPPRRRIVAHNFLSNISLDGTHNDTKLSIFRHRGLKRNNDVVDSYKDITERNGSNLCSSRSNSNNENVRIQDHEQPSVNVSSHNHKQEKLLHRQASAQLYYPDKQGIEAALTAISSTSPSKSAMPMGSLSATNSQDNKLYHSTSVKSDTASSAQHKRFRARSFSVDVPAQPRRKLFHTISICEGNPDNSEIQNDVMSIIQSEVSRSHLMSTSSSISSHSGSSKALSPPADVRVCKGPLRSICKRDRKDRLVLTVPKRSPFLVFSALPYSKEDSFARAEREMIRQSMVHQLSASTERIVFPGLEPTEEGQDKSYSQFLVPSRHRNSSWSTLAHKSPLQTITESNTPSPGLMPDGSTLDQHYEPNMLDDPELRSGKHRTLMNFPSYVTSVIDYAKPSELKADLNTKFKEKFPHIQLTLSKLRSLKKQMKKIAYIKCRTDLWTVAQSYVFFEKIILKGLINKANRKLISGTCLMLSAKLNDIKGQQFTYLLEEIEDAYKLHRKDLVVFEFAVLVALEFTLMIPDHLILPHYQRLLYMT